MACMVRILVGIIMVTSFCNADSHSTLISREIIFGNPSKVDPKISPDGKWISFRAPWNGVMNIWLQKVGEENSIPITFDQGRGVQDMQWAYDNQHILYVQDNDGDENWNLYKVDIGTKKTTKVTHAKKTKTKLVRLSPQFPEEIIIGLNDRLPSYHDLYRVNLQTGEMEKMMKNDEFFEIFVDGNFQPRLGVKETLEGGNQYKLYNGKGTWTDFITLDFNDAGAYGFAGLSHDGNTLYWSESRKRDKGALTAINLDTNEETLVVENDKVDMGDFVPHPQTGHPMAASINYKKPTWHVLDKAYQKDFDRLADFKPAWAFSINSTDLANQNWIVEYKADTKSTQYYHYNRKTGALHFLFAIRPELDAFTRAPMYPHVIRSRDGLEMVSYLTLPSWLNHESRPQQPIPVVVFVHGGPYQRDNWGMNVIHQWLANRGYGVLSVNYRGSTGFGKQHFHSSTGEWGRKMHEDILDATQWLIDEKIADPKKIAIMGRSYGGYETLVALTQSPEVYACGVDIVGISNLVTFLESFPPYWKLLLESSVIRIGGDHRTEKGREFLLSRSPLSYIDRIKKPLLIGQGENDPRVPKRESDQVVQKMQEKNIPVFYVVYPNEGHGFVRPENNLSFWGVTELFLKKCLGGRAEPLGSMAKESSMRIEAGSLKIFTSPAFTTPVRPVE